tara:strand:- start:5106 stop:5579 length:474 start_codon:yes stop_codon:yes gene_type:complete
MTTALSLFNKIRPVSIGLDSMFNQIDSMFDRELTNLVPAYSVSNYPPYNIVKVDENTYEVYVALAGISKEDIKVYKDGNSLVIEMDRKSPDAKAEWTYGMKDANVIHQGISQRYFKRSFTLADDVTVESAELKDGMLRIVLQKETPVVEEITVINVS